MLLQLMSSLQGVEGVPSIRTCKQAAAAGMSLDGESDNIKDVASMCCSLLGLAAFQLLITVQTPQLAPQSTRFSCARQTTLCAFLKVSLDQVTLHIYSHMKWVRTIAYMQPFECLSGPGKLLV